MKRIVLALLGFTLLGNAVAHDTRSAGGVQVTMSTDADDGLNVSSGTQVRLNFLHARTPLMACACRVLLYRGMPSARVPPLQDVQLTSLNAGGGTVQLITVPPGTYTLVLVGRPVQFGDFDAFKMQYVLQASAP